MFWSPNCLLHRLGQTSFLLSFVYSFLRVSSSKFVTLENQFLVLFCIYHCCSMVRNSRPFSCTGLQVITLIRNPHIRTSLFKFDTNKFFFVYLLLVDLKSLVVWFKTFTLCHSLILIFYVIDSTCRLNFSTYFLIY